MAKFSTGLRNNLLDTGSFRTQLNGGILHIYAGTPPASADDPVGGVTPLVSITVDGLGGGLTFSSSADNGTIAKNDTEVWKGTITNTGTAGWFRFVTSGDSGNSSTTEPRVQGTVGLGGTDMLVSNQLLTNSEEFTLNYFVVALPTL